MLTGSRITWFVISFMFLLPSMLVMFRSDDGITREAWGRSITFAVVIAVLVAALFGRGRQ